MEVKNPKIIWSADGVDFETLLEIIRGDDFPRDEVAIKLDRLFLTKYGLETIDLVQREDVLVFADAKIIEIPTKTMGIVKLHLEHRPWMLNVMAGICSNGLFPSEVGEDMEVEKYDALYQFAKLCKEAGTKSCAVTVLTSKTPGVALDEYNRSAIHQVLQYARMAESAGLTDLVCSPLEAEKLHDKTFVAWPVNLELNTPGVKLKSSTNADQARTMSPGKALRNGSDRLVIGRDLSRNGDFFGNLQLIKDDIEQWSQTITA